MIGFDQRAGWFLILIFGVLWSLLITHLSEHWSVNPQYSFGWLVPFIGGYLFWRRWLSRPGLTPASRAIAAIAASGAALLFFPTWLLEQPNPDWRFVSWALAIEVVVLSLAAIYFMGGRSWLAHFAFPICFILTSIPWPTAMELVLVQNLMSGIAAMTVMLLNALGIPALQQGNVIEVHTGLLGINEACSGVRSLQATFMASLFLGELYRFNVARRTVLILAGGLVAVLCNLGRAFVLAWVAARDGLEAIASWHDPAGFTILTACFLLLWLLALCLLPRRQEALPAESTLPSPRPLPYGWLFTLAAWIMISIIATETWYRAHESPLKVRWDFAWPTSKPSFREIAMSGEVTELLQYDEGRAAAWREVDGTEWTAFFFRWAAGPSRSRILARSHRPDICLPASGFQLRESHGASALKVEDVEIPFQSFTFTTKGGRPVHVFFCLWEDRARHNVEEPVREGWNRSIGLQSVARGERNLGQQVLELVVFGYKTIDEAEAALQEKLPEIVKKA